MSTLFGKYLDNIGANKAKISRLTGIKTPRLNDLSNKDTSKPSPEEYFKVVLTAILLAKRPENEFNKSFDEIFPTRPKFNFLEELTHLSRETQFLRRHFLTQKTIEEKIGMSDGKISRLGSKDVKEVLAVELICFIEGLGLDVLKTFKELYGEIDVNGNDGNSVRK